MKRIYLFVLLIIIVCLPVFADTLRIQAPDAVVRLYEKHNLKAFSNTKDTLPAEISLDYLCMSGLCCEEPTLCTFIIFTDAPNVEKANYKVVALDAEGEEKEVYFAFYQGQYIVEHNVLGGTSLLLKALDSKNEIVIRLAD